MIQRPPLSPYLLQDSDDALRTVAGLLEDVSPPHGSGASSLDLHMALGLLDRVYEIEAAADAPDSLERRVP